MKNLILATTLFLASTAFGQFGGTSGIQTGGGGGATVVVSDSTADSARVAGALPVSLTGTVRVASGVVSATASDTVGLATALAAKAPLVSPSFTTPTLGVAVATSIQAAGDPLELKSATAATHLRLYNTAVTTNGKLAVNSTSGITSTLEVGGSASIGAVTTAAPTNGLRVQGGITAPNLTTTTGTALIDAGSGVFALLTSLREKKENFSDIDNASDILEKMNPQAFDWKDKPVHEYGFIAEEMEEIDPTLAQYKDGKLINYNERAVLAVAVKVIQEQEARIAKLEEMNKSKAEFPYLGAGVVLALALAFVLRLAWGAKQPRD